MTAKHEPTHETRALVEQLAAFGIPQADIAKMVKVAKNTLLRHYAEELETGAIKANAKVAGALFKAATGTGQGAITAAIFWLKTRARWKDTQSLEVSGDLSVPQLQIYLPDNQRDPETAEGGATGVSGE